MPPHGKAKTVDLADVSPAWKVLKMKMNEEKADQMRQEATASEGASSGFQQAVDKNKLKKANNRKRKFDEEKAAAERAAKKSRDGDTVVVSSDREKGEPTQVLALDCEYVGVGDDGKEDALARVSVVNVDGKVVYDKYVKPHAKVTDYRTFISGIRPVNLVNAEPFDHVQLEVHKLLTNRIIVGHAVHNDFRVLRLNHPRKLTRDTAKAKCMRKAAKLGDRPSLKLYAERLLGIDIQKGEHDSVTDARVALRLYQMYKKQWEDEIKRFK